MVSHKYSCGKTCEKCNADEKFCVHEPFDKLNVHIVNFIGHNAFCCFSVYL